MYFAHWDLSSVITVHILSAVWQNRLVSLIGSHLFSC